MSNASSKPWGVVDPPRELTVEEKSLLRFVLSVPFPGRDELLKQLDAAQVCGKCTCGCPTINLIVDQNRATPAKVTTRTPLEADGLDTNGEPVMVILFVDKGYLSMLEIVALGEPPVAAFPKIDSLRVRAHK